MTPHLPRPGAAATTRRAFLLGAAAVGLAACGAGGGDDPGQGAAGSTAAGGTTPPAPSGGSTTATPPTTGGGGAASTTASTTGPSTTSGGGASSTTGAGAAPARFVVKGNGDDDRIALTFHTNGDLGLAKRLVDVMAEHDAVMTCFVIGNWLEANPDWGRRLLDGGHELANHTYTHPDFAGLSPTAMRTEITKCRDALQKLSGEAGRWFRPSGTSDGTATPSAAVLAAAGDSGYGLVAGWDIEPYDYQDPGASAVRDRTLAGAHGGGVVSLHFGHQGTVDALPAILDGLADKRLRTVRLSELLG